MIGQVGLCPTRAGMERAGRRNARIGAVALVALILAWRLPGAAKNTPTPSSRPLVWLNQRVKPSIAITELARRLASASVRVEVTRTVRILAIVVKNVQGQTLWQLPSRAYARPAPAKNHLDSCTLYCNTMK